MIEEVLNKYKEINEKIINNIESDLDAEGLFEEKEKIIFELINSKKYDLSEVKEMFLKLDLEESDKKLKRTLEKAMMEVKNDIRDIHNRKNASTSYNKNINSNMFFSTKV